MLLVSSCKYYVLFTDDYTHFTWLDLMKHKFDILYTSKFFVSYICIQGLQNDGSGDYRNSPFKPICSFLIIHNQLSCLHTLEQNGLHECKHRHIVDITRTLFLTCHVPLRH